MRRGRRQVCKCASGRRATGLRNGQVDERDDTIACDGVDGEGEQRRKSRSKLQMRALDSKLASALVMQSPFLESPAGSKGCWLAPKASLAPVCVQFLAPRWSLKRLPARAAARGLPKRRAGLQARTATRRSCSWVDSVGTGCFSLRHRRTSLVLISHLHIRHCKRLLTRKPPGVDIAIIYL